MCHPAVVPIALALVSAAATAYSVNQSNKTNKAMAEAANEAAGLDMARLQAGSDQVNSKSAQEKLQREMQTQRERARIRVSQGESGVSGQSSLRVLNNSLMQGSFDIGILEANRVNSQDQLNADRMDVSAGNKGRVNQANAGMTSGPMAALMIGGSAGSAYASSGGSFGSTTKPKPIQTK